MEFIPSFFYTIYVSTFRKIVITIVASLALFIIGKPFVDGITSENEEVIEKEEVTVEEPVEVVEEIIPEDYLAGIDDSFKIDENVKNLINTYLNRYFKAIYTLENVSFDDLFCDEYQLALNNCAVNLLINDRKLFNDEFKMCEAKFDYKVISYSFSNDSYSLVIRENDDFSFKCLSNVESGCYDIKIDIIVKKIGEEYKFVKFEKRQDFFVMFLDAKPKTVEDINNLYAKYTKEKSIEFDNNLVLKKQAEEQAYVEAYTYDHPYDRQKAQAYTYLYIRQRNNNYQDFSNWGGNCQSYASQMLLEGGIPMDNTGDSVHQWKYYGANLDTSENKTGRSYSWAVVDDFYDYAKSKINEPGLVSDVKCNIYYAEIGDVIQVGFNRYHGHTTVVSDIVDGYILLNSNTLNMKNFPLEAYAYDTKRLIKILGYND